MYSYFLVDLCRSYKFGVSLVGMPKLQRVSRSKLPAESQGKQMDEHGIGFNLGTTFGRPPCSPKCKLKMWPTGSIKCL